ncbi:Predicted small periplasmic lipoprotein [Serratia entomophila]|jgi:predicted small lipoprotein YifL|uniref:LPS-assembly lipoprotein LptM n=2 Tax=Serratia entomophila TaxID=42906 RepID=A0ABY5CT13_9GAMM|nr:lipoprotein [Serratia entomophila]UIW18124.1 lipoprotein [Serratia entomophila]USV01122.1 lipoprotein [Serratia entomophila]CAI0904537.1 Predicted small periplasmic lipoprotein [Serratia entomophila]CAI0933459.1 Predicted small periplasmic lipoprotein [Serratia entomophila]CAI0985488.1 Predicted small periplasmic lipoprotein [Serratia entomophila]
MQMKKQLRYALLAVMLTGLAGCGLKGPLYFPPADPADKKPAAAPVQTGEQVQKNQQELSGSQQKPSMTGQ